MDGDLDRLEVLAEQELSSLPALPPIALPPDRLGRIQAVVVRESLRLRQRERLLRAVRQASGMAAALAVVWALHGVPPRSQRPEAVTAAAQPAQLLTEWVESMRDSSRQISSVMDGSWIWQDDRESVEEADLEDLLRGLEQSSQSGWGA